MGRKRRRTALRRVVGHRAIKDAVKQEIIAAQVGRKTTESWDTRAKKARAWALIAAQEPP